MFESLYSDQLKAGPDGAGLLLSRRDQRDYRRLDAAIIDAFKADGKGWQTRINDALAKSLKGQKRRAG